VGAVVSAIGQVRATARAAAAARRVRGARSDDLIDRAVVECVRRQVRGDLALDDGVGDLGRRRRGVEPVGSARAEGGRVASILKDGLPFAGAAKLIAE